MPLRLPLKWAIILSGILGIILIVPPIFQRNYSDAGGAFFRWGIMSIAILFIGTWDEYTSQKEKK
jgi:hypothetical protein